MIKTGFKEKTIWDWLQLLIIPFVLVVAAYLFNRSQQNRTESIEATRIAEQRSIEGTRIIEQRSLDIDSNREAELQDYFDKMTELLLKESLLATKDIPDSMVRHVAQVRTITTLRAMDTVRQNVIFQFLRDTGLAEFLLVKASIDDIDLHDTNIADINLTQSRMRGANLSGCYLSRTNMSGTILREANLSTAFASEADLSDAYLDGANLKSSNLERANLSNANLWNANLSQAGFFEANLTGADLTHTDLSLTQFGNAVLNGVDFTDANVTFDQLGRAKSLEGAIMPDGEKYDPAIHDLGK